MLRFDVIKSWLQKSIRRGNTEHLLFILTKYWQLNPSKKTNIINRMKCCALEDVSPRSISWVSKIFDCLNKFHQNDTTDLELVEAGLLLSRTKKTRVCSHLRMKTCEPSSAFFQDMYKKYGKLHKLDIMKEMKSLFSMYDNKGFSEAETVRCFAAFFTGLYYRKVFSDLDHPAKISTREAGRVNKESMPREKTKRVIKKRDFKIFWNCLLDIVLNSKQNELRPFESKETRQVMYNLSYKQQFFEARPKFREELICLLSATESVCSFVFGSSLLDLPDSRDKLWDDDMRDKMQRDNNITEAVPSLEDWKQYYSNPGDNQDIIIPPYVYDCHVKGGEPDVIYFVEQGAFVTNLDNDWHIPHLETEYKKLRIKLGSGKKPTPKKSNVPPSKRSNNKPNDEEIRSKSYMEQEPKDFLKKCRVLRDCNPNTSKGPALIIQRDTTLALLFIKEMRANFNYGADQLACDKIRRDKMIPGLPPLTVAGEDIKPILMYSNYSYNRELKNFVKSEKLTVYFVSAVFPTCDYLKPQSFASTDYRISHNIDIFNDHLKHEENKEKLLSILIFRCVMGIPDTNYSNILLDIYLKTCLTNDTGIKMLSVDENFIGKYTLKEAISKRQVTRMLKDLGIKDDEESFIEAAVKIIPFYCRQKALINWKFIDDVLLQYDIPHKNRNIVKQNFERLFNKNI